MTPWTAACQASLSFTISWSLLRPVSIESVMPANHLILKHPLLILFSILPSTKVFSNESALHIRGPKYWSFGFSISPSNGSVSQSVSSVTQSYLTLCDPMDCSMPGLPVHHQLKLMSIESVMPSKHLILCRPLLLLPSIFPSIRLFTNESVLRIRWPKYWSCSFNMSPFNQYSGLIFIRTDWFDLLAF